MRAKKLFRLRPLVEDGPRTRTVLVTPDVFDEIQPPFPGDNRGPRLGELRQAMDDFIQWAEVRMGKAPFEKDSRIANMAPIHPPSSAVFDFRCNDVDAGMRCFGFFVGVDAFLALSVDHREGIKTREDWVDVVKTSQEIWKQLLGDLQPHKENNLDAYVTNCILV